MAQNFPWNDLAYISWAQLVMPRAVKGALTASRVTLERLMHDIMLVKEMGKGVWVNIF